MNCEQAEACVSENYIRCKFHEYGCKDLFPQNQLSEHCASDTHMQSIINIICVKRMNHDSALIDLTMNPQGIGLPLSAASATVNNYTQFMTQLTNSVPDTYLPSNETYESICASASALIQQMDRATNPGLNLQPNRDERQLSELMMCHISNRLTNSSSNDVHENQRIEQNQIPPPASEESTIQIYKNAILVLQTQLDEKPVSTNGCLIWNIVDIFNKITDANSRKQLAIDSFVFETIMGGHRLFVRFYPNGKINHKFISLHVHLNPPAHGNFHGDIKFVLIDQSKNLPLEHIIKSCTGEMKDVNNYLGFDEFVDKNVIQGDSNRYVLNNSICVLVYIKQTNKQKWANLPPNVQDALEAIQ